MKLNEAVSKRLSRLLIERNVTRYELHKRSGVSKSTIGDIINCTYSSVYLRVIHEICQGLDMGINDFFASEIFTRNNVEP